MQILENYEPQWMLINNSSREGESEPPDFIYRGIGDGPRMGQFEPLSNEELEELNARPEAKLENIDLDKPFSVLRPGNQRKAGAKFTLSWSQSHEIERLMAAQALYSTRIPRFIPCPFEKRLKFAPRFVPETSQGALPQKTVKHQFRLPLISHLPQ